MNEEARLPTSIETILESVVAKYHLPALGASVVRGSEVSIRAVGFRKIGSPEHVTRKDKWQIGSCTKSMTATLAAILVDEGKLQWNTTLGDAFPELRQMLYAWRDVTMDQLLAHRGGAPQNLSQGGLWRRLWLRVGDSALDQRAYLARELMTKQKPVAKPGTKFIYSNAGYALVGHIIETCLGTPWEQALRERLFNPLNLTSGGFGAPASIGTVDQPWGHSVDVLGRAKPISPGLRADNPAAIGPAGSVHCSLGDLAKYAAFHIRGTQGVSELLRPETFKKLHTRFASDSDYAYGWTVAHRDWGAGEVLTHAGSNTMNYAVIWLAPLKDFAVITCTNIGGRTGGRSTDAAAWALIQEFLIQSDSFRGPEA